MDTSEPSSRKVYGEFCYSEATEDTIKQMKNRFKAGYAVVVQVNVYYCSYSWSDPQAFYTTHTRRWFHDSPLTQHPNSSSAVVLGVSRAVIRIIRQPYYDFTVGFAQAQYMVTKRAGLGWI